MSTRPNPKRARQKERTAQRRDERYREYVRRRRQRRILILGTLGAVIAVVLVVFFFVKPSKKKAAASPTPVATAASSVACGAKAPAAAKEPKGSYGVAEDQGLDPDKTYTWRLDTSCGQIDIALDVARAPKTANSIVFLTRKHFYDGLTFHRNVPDFVIQGGDPLGNGTGSAGYKVEEAPPEDLKYDVGVVAMAKGNAEAAGTSSSQFFIMVGTSTPLPPQYALAGKVTSGMDVAQKIVKAAPGEPPTVKAYINSATIVEG